MALLALGFTGPENIKRSTRFRQRANYIKQIIKLMYPHFHRWRYEKRSVLIVWHSEGREAAREVDYYLIY
jgi:hypothetical protein